MRIIFSGLHASIGIGSRLISHLKEVIDVDVENILHKEFQLCASKESSENDIKHLRHLKEVWTKSPDGGRLLQKKRDKIKRYDVELNQSLDEASIAIKSAEKNCLNHDINTLIISRDEYTKQISRLDLILKDAKINWICSPGTAEVEKSHFTYPSTEYFSQLEQTEPTILDVYLKV